MQSDRHARISIRAYEIWLVEGRTHGRDIEHWQQAEREVAEEEMRAAAALADRATKRVAPVRSRAAKAVIKAPAKTAATKASAAKSKLKKSAAAAVAAKPRRSASPTPG